ncbi:MAG: hypothetical protein CSA62_13110 [Planctomycetota bacterium]|nr:MAG: hypothetical protein CSA62_13110 [Planctomycetota bacterium]
MAGLRGASAPEAPLSRGLSQSSAATPVASARNQSELVPQNPAPEDDGSHSGELRHKLLGQVFPSTRPRRCWVHKTGKILSKMLGHKQASAESQVRDIWMVEIREDARKAFDFFVGSYSVKNPKAVNRELLVFHDFPAEHWRQARTTNPIESMLEGREPPASSHEGLREQERLPRNGLQALRSHGQELPVLNSGLCHHFELARFAACDSGPQVIGERFDVWWPK